MLRCMIKITFKFNVFKLIIKIQRLELSFSWFYMYNFYPLLGVLLALLPSERWSWNLQQWDGAGHWDDVGGVVQVL